MLQSSWFIGTFATRGAKKLWDRSTDLVMGSSCRKPSTTMANNQDQKTFDVVVARLDEIPEGGMKEVKLVEDPATSVLLVNRNGRVSALSNKCTHYGAPLVKGSLCTKENIVRCPWHGACFNLDTGDIEDFPGLDSLQRYDVEIEAGNAIRVKGSFEQLKKKSNLISAEVKVEEEKTVVIVGGGGAAQVCAETLRSRRDQPWKGRIIMVCQEDTLPYDRPKLSKSMKSTGSDLQLRPSSFYLQAQVEAKLGARVTRVDVEDRKVHTNQGEEIGYDFLVLATGGQPRSLRVPGHDLRNVFYLRTPEDGNRIAQSATEKHVVIVGSSFIGTEVAAYLSDKAASVTVICRTAVPMEKVLGSKIGSYVKTLHETKGVRFIDNAEVTSLTPKSDDGVAFVHVSSQDEPVPADVVIVGVGVVSTTSYLEGSSVEMDSNGMVLVNEYMQSNIPQIFAAGDIANFPLDLPTIQTQVAIGHWQIAQSHGRCVALNIDREEKVPLRTVPFFWTVQFGKSIRYAGYAPQFDDILYEGDVSEGVFAAYFCLHDKVMSVATLGRDPVAADFANLLLSGQCMLKKDLLEKMNK